jgi:threonine/homoserine efflux transporter RhtA
MNMLCKSYAITLQKGHFYIVKRALLQCNCGLFAAPLYTQYIVGRQKKGKRLERCAGDAHGFQVFSLTLHFRNDSVVAAVTLARPALLSTGMVVGVRT